MSIATHTNVAVIIKGSVATNWNAVLALIATSIFLIIQTYYTQTS